MQSALLCHPATPCDAIARIEASAQRMRGNRLGFRFVLHGDIDKVRLPVAAAPVRCDGLWEHTCLEAFVGADDDPAYLEFNYSPSSAWAAYRFSAYRAGMTTIDGMASPGIEVRSGIGVIELTARVRLPTGVADQPLRVALAAVIEQCDGQRSYWALHHPREKPDFHHEGGFTMRIEAPAQPRTRITRS
jgi:hypothetical protein